MEAIVKPAAGNNTEHMIFSPEDLIKARSIQREACVGRQTLARHIKKFGIEPILRGGVRYLRPSDADLLRLSLAEIPNAQRERGAKGAAARAAKKKSGANKIDLSNYVRLSKAGHARHLIARAEKLGIEIVRKSGSKGGRPAAYVLASDFERLLPAPEVAKAPEVVEKATNKLTPEAELKQLCRRIKILVSNLSGDVEIVIIKENGHEVKAEITRTVVQTETLS